MPVHCGEQWIGAALHSLVQQDEAGIEVLVLDSSPTPATLDVVRRFEERLDIRYLPSAADWQWHAKTNHASAAARADHLCWLHHDDLWLPGRARQLRGWIEDDPDAALHLSPSAIVDGAGRRLGTWHCPFAGDRQLDADAVTERLLVQNFVATPAPVFRKDAFLATGGLDECLWYTADWDLWLKLARMGPVRHHDAVTVGYRVHGSSLTVAGSRDAADFERQMQIVVARYLPGLGARGRRIGRACRASIRVNCALAAASAGQVGGLAPAAARVLSLGPAGILRYLRDSRIVERILPRVRARLAGAL